MIKAPPGTAKVVGAAVAGESFVHGGAGAKI
jgi:hypothetical protein